MTMPTRPQDPPPASSPVVDQPLVSQASPLAEAKPEEKPINEKVTDAGTSSFANIYNYAKETKIAKGGQWLAGIAAHAAYTGGIKAAAGAYLWTTGYNEKHYKKAIASELSAIAQTEKMTPQFANAIDSLTETLTNLLIGTIEDETLKELITYEKNDLSGFIQLTLLKFFHNLEQYPLPEGQDPPDILGKAIVRLLHLANTHLPKIHQDLADCEAIQDPVEKQTRLSHLYYTLYHEFIQMAFPHGKSDIPAPYPINTIIFEVIKAFFMQHPNGAQDVDAIYPINNLIWNNVIAKIPPNLMATFHHQLMDPIKAIGKDKLLDKQNGELLIHASEIIGAQTSELMPGVIAGLSKILADKASNAFAGSTDKKNWLKSWLGHRINDIAKSDHPEILKAWQFVGHYLESMLMATFSKIAESYPDDDLLAGVAKKLLSEAGLFFKENNMAIASKVANPEKSPEVEKELEAMFKPLTNKILSAFGWDDPKNLPVPDLVKGVVVEAIQEELPKLFLQLYRDITLSQINDSAKKEKLDHVEETKEAMHVVMDHLNPVIKDTVAEFSEDISKEAIGAIDQKFLKENLGEEDKKELASLLQGLIKDISESEDVHVLEAFSFAQSYIEKFIMQMVVHLADDYHKSTERIETAQHQKKNILSSAILHLLGVVTKNLKGLDAELMARIETYDAMDEGKDKDLAKKALLKAFEPASAALLHVVDFNNKKALPVPDLIKQPIMDAFKETVIPNLLLKLYKDMISIKPKSDAIEAKLVRKDGADKLEQMSAALSKSLVPIIKGALAGSGIQISQMLNNVLAEKPVEGKSESIHFSEATEQAVGKELDQCTAYLNATNAPSSAVWDFAQRYLESLIKYGVGNLAMGPSSDPEGDILFNAFHNLLNISGKNIEELNKNLSDKFKTIEKLPEGKEKENQLKNLAMEFAPFCKELLKAAGLTDPEQLPVPFFLKKVLWNSLNETILPQFLMKVYKDISASGKPDTAFVQKLAQIKDAEHLQEIAEVGAENFIPIAKEQLVKSDKAAAAKIHEALAGTGFEFLDPDWIEKGIDTLIEGNQPGIQQSWSFVQLYLEKILLHMLNNAAVYGAGEGVITPEKKAALPSIIAGIMNAAEKYFKEKNSHIEAKIEKLLAENPAKTREQHLIDLFTQEAFNIVGLNEDAPLPFPSFAKKPVLNALKEKILPPILYNLYKDIVNPQKLQPDYHNKLNAMLVEEGHISPEISALVKTFQIGTTPQELQNKLWELTGTAEAAKNVETTCSLLAGEIKQGVKNYLAVEADDIARMLNELLPGKHFQTTAEGQLPWLAEAIKAVAGSQGAMPQGAWDYLDKMIETGLLKVLVTLADSAVQLPVAEGQNPKDMIGANIIVMLLTVMEKHRKEISVEAAKAKKIKDPKAKQEKLRKVFEPVAADLLKIGEKDGDLALSLKDLPVPEVFKETLWNALKTKLLPDLLSKIYTDTIAWEDAAKTEKKKMHDLWGTTHPEYFIGAISQYVQDYLPFYLSTSKDELGGTIFNAFEEYLKNAHDKEKAKAVSDYLNAHKQTLQSIIGQNIQAIGEGDDQAVQQAWPAVKEYVEAALYRLFTGFGESIKYAESEDPDFLVDTAIAAMKIMTDHFQTINRVTAESDKSYAYKVTDEAMRKGFGKKRHPGVPLNPKDIPENDKIRLQNFFVPLGKKLLSLAKIDGPQDLPVPAPIQEKVWEIFQEKMLPEVMMNIYKKILDPDTIDTLLLSSLESLNTALESLPADGISEEEEDLHEDPKQKELNTTCGKLVKQLVEMLPPSLTTFVFTNIKAVQQMSAEALGKAVRTHLGKWTLLELIDTGMFKGLPNWHPGEWTKPPGVLAGQEKYIPHKVVMQEGVAVSSTHEMKFDFPKTPEEKAALLKVKEMQSAANLKKLKSNFTKTISNRMKSTFKGFITGQWNKFQGFLDRSTRKYFGEFGLKVKQQVDKIFHKVFFTAIGNALAVVFYPIYKLSWFIIDWQISRQVDVIIKDMHLKIHESMVYKVSDAVVDRLGAANKDKQYTKLREEALAESAPDRRRMRKLRAAKKAKTKFMETMELAQEA